MICNKYANGRIISELSDEYFLSLDSIKKIIYSKKKDKNLEYAPTLFSAVEYTNAGMVEEWIHSFLLFTCNNTKMSDELMEGEYIHFGVAKLPLRLIQTEDFTEKHVTNLVETYGRNVSDMPPLIISFTKNKFYAVVQSELFIALRKRKINAYPTIILMQGDADYKIFMKNYGRHLMFIDRI